MGRFVSFGAGLGFWLGASWLFRLPRFHDHLSGPSLIAGYSLIAVGCLSLFFSLQGLAARRLPGILVYLGKISYGLYVFHMLVLQVTAPLMRNLAQHYFLDFGGLTPFFTLYALALGATGLLSIVSYKYLETPFLVLKKRFTFIPSRAI